MHPRVLPQRIAAAHPNTKNPFTPTPLKNASMRIPEFVSSTARVPTSGNVAALPAEEAASLRTERKAK
jgi:hypothetical protein